MNSGMKYVTCYKFKNWMNALKVFDINYRIIYTFFIFLLEDAVCKENVQRSYSERPFRTCVRLLLRSPEKPFEIILPVSTFI